MSHTILVVDDEEAVARPLVKLLEFEGFTALYARNGEEGLARLRDDRTASAIVLDLRMPVMDGWAFRREQLRDPSLASIPVLVLSGADENRVGELAAVAVFHKPMPLAVVITEIKRLCASECR